MKLKPDYHPNLGIKQPSALKSDIFYQNPAVLPEPIGPVLLEKRPYEVVSVQPVPITVSDGYSTFDCRNVPFTNKHYADLESGCQV